MSEKMTKSDTAAAIVGILIMGVIALAVIFVCLFGFSRMMVGEDKYTIEIIEIYDITIVDKSYYLKTNSTVWPNDPMRVKIVSSNDVKQIIFAKIGDIVEMEYRVNKRWGAYPTYHHIKITILETS